MSKSENKFEVRGAIKDFLSAYPSFLESTMPLLTDEHDKATKNFLEILPTIVNEYDNILAALSVPEGQDSGDGELLDISKLSQKLDLAIKNLLPELDGEELSKTRSASMRVQASLEQLDQIFSQTEKRGLPARNPEGGIHGHGIDRKNKQTLRDGLHPHIVLMDGQLFISKEDGPHWHLIKDGARRSEGGDPSKHNHMFVFSAGLRLPTGMVLEKDTEVFTEVGGDHDHDLMVQITAFDGTHDHDMILPDGSKIKTLSVAEFVAMHPPIGDPPEVGTATDILKGMYRGKGPKDKKPKTKADDCPECETAIAKHLDDIDADFDKAWKESDYFTLKAYISKQTDVQSLVLSKTRFKTVAEARAWVKENGGITDKVDEKPNTFRFRQFNPSLCKDGTFRNKKITEGVIAVICVPKGKDTPEGLKNSAKKGEIQTAIGVITGREPVKDATDVFNYTVGIGPIEPEDLKKFANIVEIEDKPYTVVSQTVSSKADHKPGDRVKVQFAKLLVDQADEKIGMRWESPEFVDTQKSDSALTVIREFVNMSRLGRINKVYRDVLTKKMPLVKMHEERYVLGIVLEPETVDSQNEIYSHDVVRKTAHGWMEFFGNLGNMHREIITGKVKVLETYLAPIAFDMDGQHVKKGTWLMGTRIIDNELWSDIKDGRITGYSIGGNAVRLEEGIAP